VALRAGGGAVHSINSRLMHRGKKQPLFDHLVECEQTCQEY
jgi:hypothetical protein